MATTSKRIKLDFIVTESGLDFTNEEIAANFKEFLKREFFNSTLLFNTVEVTDE